MLPATTLSQHHVPPATKIFECYRAMERNWPREMMLLSRETLLQERFRAMLVTRTGNVPERRSSPHHAHTVCLQLSEMAGRCM